MPATNTQYDFAVIPVEDSLVSVASPQLIAFRDADHVVRVWVYLMLNNALSVTSGQARAAMGKIRLSYSAESPSGALTASQRLAKLEFIFPDMKQIPDFELVDD